MISSSSSILPDSKPIQPTTTTTTTTTPSTSHLRSHSPPSLIITASTPQMGSPTLPSHQSQPSIHQSQAQSQATIPNILNNEKPSSRLPPILRARAASQSLSLSRPPSLIQLTEAMRLNPNRWQQLKLDTNSIKSTSSISSAPPLPADQSPDSATSMVTPTTSISSSRPRLQLSSLQRSAHPTSQNSSLPFSNYSINPQQTQQTSESQPTPDSSNNLSVQPLSPTLQRRASASDITIGLNRARLPSLAAIQERMARTKTVEINTSASPQPPPSNPSPIVPPIIKEEEVKIIEPIQEAKSTEPTKEQPKPTQILSSIPPSLRADILQSNALDQPSGPSLGTPNPAPSEPASVTVPKPVHPLQHSWTLFFDSKATLASAKKAPNTPNTSNTDDSNHPTPTLGAGGQAYHDALQTIGTFQSVEDFCRFFNWTIRPSQMEMHSSVQLFKTGIRPMWEDPANANGGKWTLTMKQPNPPLLDRIWTFLVLGLVGEEVDVLDDVCGAIVATRPRGNRVQIWMREKSNIERVNGLGKRLMKVLEINEESGVSLEFSPHSGHNHSASKFISIQGNASPQQRPTLGSPQLSNYTHSPRSTSGGGGGVSGMLFQRSPSTGSMTTSNEMRRTNSLEQQSSPRVPSRPPLMMHHSHLAGPTQPNGMVRPVLNQLNSADVPIQNGIWRPSGPPPPSLAVTPPGLPGNQMTGALANKIGGVGKSMMMMMMNNSNNGNPTSHKPNTNTNINTNTNTNTNINTARPQGVMATMNTP